MENPFRSIFRTIGSHFGGTSAVSTVTSLHPDYVAASKQWRRIDATLEGADGVKEIADEFIPMTLYDKRHPDHYRAYIERGNFVNFTLQTVNKMAGMIARKDPSVKVPSQFSKRMDNINNAGDDFTTFAKKAVDGLIRHGRIGLLGDYVSEEEDSIFNPLSGYPYLSIYGAHSITNWRQRNIGGELVTDQVVLRESYLDYQDIGAIPRPRYKVLELDPNGIYRVRVFERRQNGEFFHARTVYPGRKSATGQGMRKIPFTFISAVDLSPTVHRSPILDLVDVNLSHFKTSCDLEGAQHILSQPTCLISGLEEDDTSVFEVGGGQVWKLPAGASAAFLEMRADGQEGVERTLATKEKQMREIGAAMLSSTSDAPETAAAVRIKQHAATSILSSIAGTCSSGLQAALQTLMDWDGIAGTVNIELNQDFIEASIDPQMLSELNKMVDAGNMTKRNLAYNLIKAELTEPGKTLDQILDELETEKPISLTRYMKPAVAVSEALETVNANGGSRPQPNGGRKSETGAATIKIQAPKQPEKS